jgi:hypothetical protein
VKDAAAVIEAYHAAINAKECERAYRLWESDGSASGKTLDAFRAGFAKAAAVRFQIGPPSRIEPAAGSRFVTIPVRVIARSTTGETERFEGEYVLRRSVVDGATPGHREWRIASAKMKRVG